MILKMLILDDDLNRLKEFRKRMSEINAFNADIVEDAPSCIEKLKQNEYDMIFLDHDLGGKVYVSNDDENTGSAVARWMHENKNNLDAIIILHSLNDVGRKNMKYILSAEGRTCYEFPWIWEREQFHQKIKQN